MRATSQSHTTLYSIHSELGLNTWLRLRLSLMLSILSLCCHRVRAVEQRSPRLELASDATGDRHQDRINDVLVIGPGHTETVPLRPSDSTESIHIPPRVARRLGIDPGMGPGRHRLEGASSGIPGPRIHIARKSRQNALPKTPRRNGGEDDEPSIISDPQAIYLAPLITVSSTSTAVRTSPVSDGAERSTMESAGSTSATAPSPTGKQLTTADGTAADNPSKDCGAESTTPSKPDSVLADDDHLAPFKIWLLTQTLDTDISPSQGAATGTKQSHGDTPASYFRPRQPPEGDTSSPVPAPTPESLKAPGFVSVPAPATIAHTKHQECTGRYALNAPCGRRESYTYGTDPKAYPFGADDLGARRPYSLGQRTISDSNSLGRRDIYRSLSALNEDERAFGVYRSSDRSSYKTAMDTMSVPGRGMSDSSNYEAGSAYESTVPGHFVRGPFPDISISSSTEEQDISALSDAVRVLANSRAAEQRTVRSKFREEFGNVVPDPSPRFRIVSKLRALSRQRHPPVNDKRAGEVASSDVSLSDCDPKNVQTPRNMLYHGCLQATGSAPEGWQQGLYHGDLSTPDFYLGESRSVNDFEALVGSAARSGFHRAAEPPSRLVPNRIRTLREMSQVTEDFFTASGGGSIGAPEHHLRGTRDISSEENQALHNRDPESRDLGCSTSDGFGATMGSFERTAAEPGNTCRAVSARWPFSRVSGNARKPESNCVPSRSVSLGVSESRP